MAYTVTTWINDVAPPLNATNLNKLTNEIRAQALANGIAHALPTWVNGSPPALTDAAPLNELERVTLAVAIARGLSYSRSTWQSGWTPSRNATNLNKLEQQVAANAAAVTPPPPPPPGPILWSGPITITQGGTYTGNWQSTSTAPAVTINTSSPVTILNSNIRKQPTNMGGDLIRGIGGGFSVNDVTIQGTHIYGGVGRILDFENFNRIIVRNNTIDRTSGMKITVNNPGATILVTRNKMTNVQGPDTGGAALSQLCQLGGIIGAGSCEVSWNWVHNDPELSHCEDILSLFNAHNVWVHDNYFEGQWTVGNQTTSSQNGITNENGSSNNLIERNQVIAAMGIGIFPGSSGCMVQNNRVVRSGLYPDGVTRANIGFSGIGISPGTFASNHLHNNLSGYVAGQIHGFVRVDWADDSMPPDCLPTNTRYSGTVTQASEQAERTFWLNKLAANGITVGAGGTTAPPPEPPPPGIWSAGMEGGNLNEWSLNSGGGEYNDEGGDSIASQDIAHTGTWSAKCSTDADGDAGTRLFRWEETRANRELYLSAWFYFPEVYTLTHDPGSGRYFNLFQIKSLLGSANDPLWFIDLQPDGSGGLTPWMDWWHATLEGPHSGESGRDGFPPLVPVTVPVDQWFEVKMFLRQSSDFDGTVKVWWNGTLIHDFTNVRTAFMNGAYNSWNCDNQWSVNCYTDGISPAPAVIYIDDAEIRTA